ncbi:hypothetical protein [Bradyrhizobium sp. UNPF46]|uniref:hypothetical protein n=1 Tax=Bradyrhizobium sp. UNPF46 TaxID=1141168 RepID=UPI0015F055B5|nr:hypothetical protein [Bradyrhizobium sp. UNPF46]
MTTNPEAKGRHAKIQHGRAALRRFVLNCHGASIGWSAETGVIALDCGSTATGRKLQTNASASVLKFKRSLLTGEFHVAILATIGIGRSTVRFATLSLKTRTDFGSPFVAWHAKKRPRRFYI